MHTRHPLHPRALAVPVFAALATLLAACNGPGYTNGSGGSSGGVTCGGTYSIACPSPTVSITAPTAAATVSGTVTLTATAMAATNYGLTIANVALQVDGTTVATVTSAPYSYSWDSTTVANGTHTISAIATDSAGDTGSATPVTITVANAGAGAAAAALGAEQIFPAPDSKAAGTGRFNVQADSGVLSGAVTVSGMSARGVAIHEGFAGSSGETLLTLTPSARHADEWDVPANAVLSGEQLAALAQGRLYVIATSAAYPQGEIRGQLLPDGVRVSFSGLHASEAELALGRQSAGVAAATLDARAATLTVHVNVAGLDDATGAAVAGSEGAPSAELARDSVDMGHFSGALAHLSDAALADFEAGRLTVSVAAASAPQGALRGALAPAAARGD